MAKMIFTQDIGYYKCNLQCNCNVNTTTVKGHLAGSVRI